MATPIRQLLALITQSVETLEAVGTTMPNLHAPFEPSSEAFRANPEAAEAARIIGAAALQLEAIVTPPQVSLFRIISGHAKSSALRICIEAGVVEILREAGPQGIHVKDIASKNGQDPERLARFIRFLATHHIFREVSPNVFAHTRISSMLDTRKSSAEILADPEHKHDGTMGLVALVSSMLDENFKASAYAWETLADPATRNSGDPTASPFARAMGRAETMWAYLARPEEQFRQHRFNIGMAGAQAFERSDSIVKAYDWGRLPAQSVVVDVGGGVGTACLALAAKFPELRFVVQDLEPVIEQGKTIWNNKMPSAISSGQVTLQVHDFFAPQPQTGAAVFMMKHVTHDWSDEYCFKILKQLSAVAGPGTTLLLVEAVLPLAIQDPNAVAEGLQEAPAPLLANYGGTNDLGYMADFMMFLQYNAQERTRMQFTALLARTGWEFVAVHRLPGDHLNQCVEAKKAAALE
ncbi:S-adenosyl-L-methionine-dependent methyltransferase [Mycena galopus ATCC 62051]|nr:S-adenosyl-L-methionine-dependent methyltransferase [Mycena galopus ATCC 62051]